MKKIAIIISGNYFKGSISIYENYLSDDTYDIIVWNRRGIIESGVISFNNNASENHGYFWRLIQYFKYRNFVLKQIKLGGYDRIIVSTIALGIMLYPFLKKNYKGKYILDIRDYSIMALLKKRTFKHLISDSAFVGISSKGFLSWLPIYEKYFYTSNFPFKTVKDIKLLRENSLFDPFSNPIKIYTIGSLRDLQPNLDLIKPLSNNTNFFLKFIGSGPVEYKIKEYVTNNKVLNIAFHGYYKKEDELELISDASFLNLLTVMDINGRSLITNRFYLSVLLGIPMIVFNDTYQGMLVKKYSLGCAVRKEKLFIDELYNYMNKFDRFEFDQGRKAYINDFYFENERFKKVFIDFSNL